MRRHSSLTLVLILLFLLIGCEEDTGTLPGNHPPTTYLSVRGAELDTTDYRKILNWWGTDADGEISGYLIRWDGGWEPPEGTEETYQGELYSLTTATEDTFNVPLHDSYGVRTFRVRAVDDLGLVDPDGVTQEFPLSDSIPRLYWNPDIPRPTRSLAAVAFGWNPADKDGRETVSRFRVWLDGDSADARTVRDTIFAFSPEDFGEDIDRERTVFVQAIDDAEAVSNIISHTWYVESPRGEWLFIDSIDGPGSSSHDRPFFQAVLDSVTNGSLHTIDMVDGPDFVTEVEVEPLFSLFRGVIWVTGPYKEANDEKMARNLRTAEKGITAYVEEGGRVLLCGQSLIGYRGGLSDAFAGEVLGIPGYYVWLRRDEARVIRVSDLSLNGGAYCYFGNLEEPDSIEVQSTSLRTDFFQTPQSPGHGRYRVRPGALLAMNGFDQAPVPPQDADPAYFGVISDYGSGRICLVTVSYARLFPRAAPGDPVWGEQIREGVSLFREVLTP